MVESTREITHQIRIIQSEYRSKASVKGVHCLKFAMALPCIYQECAMGVANKFAVKVLVKAFLGSSSWWGARIAAIKYGNGINTLRALGKCKCGIVNWRETASAPC